MGKTYRRNESFKQKKLRDFNKFKKSNKFKKWNAKPNHSLKKHGFNENDGDVSEVEVDYGI